MTKKPAAQPKMSPSPFSSSAEREELERALLLSTTTTAAEQSDTTSPQNFVLVPTAVPIVGDTFDENNGVPVVAVATSMTASLPPPPSAPAVASSSRTNDANNDHKKSTKKNESFIDDDVIVRPEPPSHTNDNNFFPLPTAPTIPTYTTHLPSTQQHTASAQLRAANVRGNISSEEEKVDVARAQRQRNAINYHADEAVMTANAKAARKAGRRDEGLTVDEGMHHSGADTREGEKQVDDDGELRPYGNNRKQGQRGYDVNEYDTAEYDTGDYDVTEYKSVYD